MGWNIPDYFVECGSDSVFLALVRRNRAVFHGAKACPVALVPAPPGLCPVFGAATSIAEGKRLLS